VTVFDVSLLDAPPLWPLFLLAAIVAMLIAVAVSSFRKPFHPLATRFRIHMLAFAAGLCAILLLLGSLGFETRSLQNAQREGKAEVIQGIVEDFHPMPRDGHDTERFRVGAERFSYSDFTASGGFSSTSSHGGPIRSGLPVRVFFVRSRHGNVITKLEIGPRP
jgi:hypothetical protein